MSLSSKQFLAQRQQIRATTHIPPHNPETHYFNLTTKTVMQRKSAYKHQVIAALKQKGYSPIPNYKNKYKLLPLLTIAVNQLAELKNSDTHHIYEALRIQWLKIEQDAAITPIHEKDGKAYLHYDPIKMQSVYI